MFLTGHVTKRKAQTGMTNARRARALATAVLLLAAVTACADDSSEANPTKGTTTTSSEPATTSTTAAPTENDVAAEAASQLLRAFYLVRNQLRQDPSRPIKQLKTVSTSVELAAQENLFKRERKEGLHQTGESKIALMQVQSINLDNSDPKAGKVPTVQIDVCFDVTDVDILDANGKSVVGPDRPDTGWIRYTIANYEWDSDPEGAWRVASSQDIERTPCDAA